MLKNLMSMPFVVGREVMDAATGGNRVHVDTTHHVRGDSASRWADDFSRDPTRISPMAHDTQRVGSTTYGRPFPGAPQIGIEVKARHDEQLADGRQRTRLDVQYRGGFEGPGTITVEEDGRGGLSVRDRWDGVRNRSMIPSRAAEMGHPLVAAMGFSQFGKK